MWTLQSISRSTHKLHWNIYLSGEICVFSIGKFLLQWGHQCYGVSYSSVQHSWGNYCKMSVILLQLQRSRYLSSESQGCSPFYPALSAFNSVSSPQTLTPRTLWWLRHPPPPSRCSVQPLSGLCHQDEGSAKAVDEVTFQIQAPHGLCGKQDTVVTEPAWQPMLPAFWCLLMLHKLQIEALFFVSH